MHRKIDGYNYFKPGDKVVFKKAMEDFCLEQGLTIGKTYTVKEMRDFEDCFHSPFGSVKGYWVSISELGNVYNAEGFELYPPYKIRF